MAGDNKRLQAFSDIFQRPTATHLGPRLNQPAYQQQPQQLYIDPRQSQHYARQSYYPASPTASIQSFAPSVSNNVGPRYSQEYAGDPRQSIYSNFEHYEEPVNFQEDRERPQGPRPLPGPPIVQQQQPVAQGFYQRPYSTYDYAAYNAQPPQTHIPTGNPMQIPATEYSQQSWPALSRKSSESVRVMPTQPRMSPQRNSERAMSFTSASGHQKRPSFPSPHSSGSQHTPNGSNAPSAIVTATRRTPIVYPALLSKVAEAFKARVSVSERVKDGLSYKESFDGRDAVDKIAYIIKTTDRNLALLLGRALDAQKFFHDVTYDHRLRDSPNELYQFRERLTFVSTDELSLINTPAISSSAATSFATDPFSSTELSRNASTVSTSEMEHKPLLTSEMMPEKPFSEQFEDALNFMDAQDDTLNYSHATPRASHITQRPRRPSATDTMLSDDFAMPSGVFTLLTDCYSPTCTRDRLCYSIACPRRLEQQARLKLKPQPGLKKSISTESLGDLKEPGTLWIHSVPQEVADSVDDKEKRRQEAINECIYTERDFLRDIEYLRDSWIKGIRTGTAVPDARKEDLIVQVFWNVLDIHTVSHKLAEHLSRRQKQAHVVHQIGDIYVDNIPNFEPFVQYGAHQLFGKYEFEKEKGGNPAFSRWVEEMERAPESRKLELNAYLTKPTTRLARYPLLLEVVLKHTPEGHPDQIAIPKAVKMIREFLSKVNEESGKSENRFNLAQLDTQLIFKPGEAVDLKLREECRELIFKGPLKKRGGTQSESAELQVFLFDHALLMAKQKTKNEQYKVYRKPIPLELLIVSTIDETSGGRSTLTTRSRTLISRTSTTASGKSSIASIQPPPSVMNSKSGFAMTFTHLGRRGYDITLWSATWSGRKNWLDHIEQRQIDLRDRSMVFDHQVLTDGYFVGANRVTCAAPFDAGNRLVYGTDSGVYVSDLRDRSRVPVKVIQVPNVTQVDVLDEYGILIVLADKAIQTFYIDHLDPSDAVGAAKRARKISSNASFFKTGICMGRTLVCIVKAGAVSSTIKTMEPIEQSRSGGHKKPLRKFLQTNHDMLRVFKEFYLPSSADSIHFLKSKLCVGIVRGFEIVDLETLDTQGLLDPADSSLDFVQKRENCRPIAIYRIDGEFLLCYDEFAFYVNKNGWRTKANWLVQWEGRPTHFALHHPFVLAFEPTFVEVRHVESGALLQIIPGNNLRLLYSDTPPSSSASTLQNYTAANYYYSQQMQQPSQRSSMNGYPNQAYARSSMYSNYPQQQHPGPSGFNPYMKPTLAVPIRSHSQIIFSDNYHQVFKMVSAIS